ncbi:MAG: transposase [bacterium]|nr:transposase [bacterium]
MAKRYTANDKRAVLEQFAAGVDVATISEATGIAVGTLRAWQRKHEQERASHLRAEMQRLEARLIESSHTLLDGLAAMVENAPLNQRATALGIFIDRCLKLQAATALHDAQTSGAIIRVEYLYPDGQVQQRPPWAEAASEQPVAQGGLWPSRADGDSRPAVRLIQQYRQMDEAAEERLIPDD